MKEPDLAACERSFVLSALAENRRLDGRALNQFEDLKIYFGSEWGSCLVVLGETKVSAHVSCSVEQPRATRPNEGLLLLYVEIGPMAAPHFYTRAQQEQTVELNRLLEKCIKDSGCCDLESLCIAAEEKVWALRVDVRVLAHGGSVADAASAAAVCALGHFRRPQTPDVCVADPVPLSLRHRPACVSYALLPLPACGARALAGPTALEERAADAQLVFALNGAAELCTLHLRGRAALPPSSVLRLAGLAARRAARVSTAVQAALERDLRRRSEGQAVGFEDCLGALATRQLPVQLRRRRRRKDPLEGADAGASTSANEEARERTEAEANADTDADASENVGKGADKDAEANAGACPVAGENADADTNADAAIADAEEDKDSGGDTGADSDDADAGLDGGAGADARPLDNSSTTLTLNRIYKADSGSFKVALDDDADASAAALSAADSHLTWLATKRNLQRYGSDSNSDADADFDALDDVDIVAGGLGVWERASLVGDERASLKALAATTRRSLRPHSYSSGSRSSSRLTTSDSTSVFDSDTDDTPSESSVNSSDKCTGESDSSRSHSDWDESCKEEKDATKEEEETFDEKLPKDPEGQGQEQGLQEVQGQKQEDEQGEEQRGIEARSNRNTKRG